MPRIHDIMSGKDRSLGGKLARVGLLCLEPFYRGIVGVRNAMFDWGIRKPKKLPRPVISVGNITTGGTGKTPMVMFLRKKLAAMGFRTNILTRGYGGDEDVLLGDNAVRGGNRYKAGLWAVRWRPSVQAFILDDGFQHRQLARDLDIVLIDATCPFGYGHVLPRGMLRESRSRLQRSHVLIITRSDQVDSADLESLRTELQRLAPGKPILHSIQTWTGYHQSEPGPPEAPWPTAVFTDSLPVNLLRQTKVAATIGIGNPAAFERTLEKHVGEITSVRVLADHYPFERAELVRWIEEDACKGAQAIVTTEKDWVKWERILPNRPWTVGLDTVPGDWVQPIPVYCPVLDIEIVEGSETLDALLKKTLAV